VTFPADFITQPLSGKQAVYEVEVVQVKEKILPEVNDEFAKEWGAETAEKLKEGVRKDLEAELAQKTRQSIRSQLVQAVSQRVQCELPESLVQGETRNLIYNIVAENQQRGIERDKIEEKKDEIFGYASQSAKEKLKVAFLLGRIAEKEGIRVTREELMHQILAISQQREMRPEKLIKEMEKTNGLARLQEDILLSKVVDFLEQNAKIEEVPAPPEANA
jgi:trigger factor